MGRNAFERNWYEQKVCKRCKGGVCVHGCVLGCTSSKVIRREFLPLCEKCYSVVVQQQKSWTYEKRVQAGLAGDVVPPGTALVPFTIDEYRKTDGFGRQSYRKSVLLQRMQTAMNEANISFEKLRQTCRAHDVVFEPYSVRKYAALKKRIENGEIICVGFTLHNLHEGCDACVRIRKFSADYQGYKNTAAKWRRQLAAASRRRT